jgi:hypothetical protein
MILGPASNEDKVKKQKGYL